MTDFQEISDSMMEKVLEKAAQLRDGVSRGTISPEEAREQAGSIGDEITTMLDTYPETEYLLSEEQHATMSRAVSELELAIVFAEVARSIADSDFNRSCC